MGLTYTFTENQVMDAFVKTSVRSHLMKKDELSVFMKNGADEKLAKALSDIYSPLLRTYYQHGSGMAAYNTRRLLPLKPENLVEGLDDFEEWSYMMLFRGEVDKAEQGIKEWVESRMVKKGLGPNKKNLECVLQNIEKATKVVVTSKKELNELRKNKYGMCGFGAFAYAHDEIREEEVKVLRKFGADEDLAKSISEVYKPISISPYRIWHHANEDSFAFLIFDKIEKAKMHLQKYYDEEKAYDKSCWPKQFEAYLSSIKLVLDNFDKVQQIITDAKEEINRLRIEKYCFDSIIPQPRKSYDEDIMNGVKEFVTENFSIKDSKRQDDLVDYLVSAVIRH